MYVYYTVRLKIDFQHVLLYEIDSFPFHSRIYLTVNGYLHV